MKQKIKTIDSSVWGSLTKWLTPLPAISQSAQQVTVFPHARCFQTLNDRTTKISKHLRKLSNTKVTETKTKIKERDRENRLLAKD